MKDDDYDVYEESLYEVVYYIKNTRGYYLKSMLVDSDTVTRVEWTAVKDQGISKTDKEEADAIAYIVGGITKVTHLYIDLDEID